MGDRSMFRGIPVTLSYHNLAQYKYLGQIRVLSSNLIPPPVHYYLLADPMAI
jgi:hypothetical protein